MILNSRECVGVGPPPPTRLTSLGCPLVYRSNWTSRHIYPKYRRCHLVIIPPPFPINHHMCPPSSRFPNFPTIIAPHTHKSHDWNDPPTPCGMRLGNGIGVIKGREGGWFVMIMMWEPSSQNQDLCSIIMMIDEKWEAEAGGDPSKVQTDKSMIIIIRGRVGPCYIPGTWWSLSSWNSIGSLQSCAIFVNNGGTHITGPI